MMTESPRGGTVAANTPPLDEGYGGLVSTTINYSLNMPNLNRQFQMTGMKLRDKTTTLKTH